MHASVFTSKFLVVFITLRYNFIIPSLISVVFLFVGLDNTDCNDNDTTVSLFDLSTEDSPHAICSDIDEVKTSSPIPSDEHSSLFPSVVHISTLQRRNGYNRVSITTKPETKMVRWNTIGDLREIKPSKRRKKQLQFKKEGHELAKGEFYVSQ